MQKWQKVTGSMMYVEIMSFQITMNLELENWETFLEYSLPSSLTEEEKQVIRNSVSEILAARYKEWVEKVERVEEMLSTGSTAMEVCHHIEALLQSYPKAEN
jgi:hypothetical protein